MLEHANVKTVANLYATDPVFAGLKNQHSALHDRIDELSAVVARGGNVPELQGLKRQKLKIRVEMERIYEHCATVQQTALVAVQEAA